MYIFPSLLEVLLSTIEDEKRNGDFRPFEMRVQSVKEFVAGVRQQKCIVQMLSEAFNDSDHVLFDCGICSCCTGSVV